MTRDLKLAALVGAATLSVDQASGTFADFAALAAKLDCDVTPAAIKELALRFSKDNASLGEIRVSGPFDLANTTGKLQVAVLGIDRQVLNLAGATTGIDFGTTTMNTTNMIELTQAGALHQRRRSVDLGRLQITANSKRHRRSICTATTTSASIAPRNPPCWKRCIWSAPRISASCSRRN